MAGSAPAAGDEVPAVAARKWPLIQSRKRWLDEKQSIAALKAVGAAGEQSSISADKMLQEEQASGSPLIGGNEVTLLSDGPATYTAMLDAIAKARKLILLESYILDNDAVGERFARALTARAKAGVTVALMVDSVGTLSTPEAYFDALREAGIQIVYFNSLNPLKSSFGWTINARDHRKVLVVDGAVAFTGGLNLSEVYSSRPGSGGSRARRKALQQEQMNPEEPGKEPPWRDTHVRIRGPAAMGLQRAFLEGWAEQGGEPIAAAAANNTVAEAGKELVRIVSSGPEEGSSIYWTLLGAIGRAQKSVHITMGYFVPNREFLEALTDAAARDVEVHLVLPGFSDFWAVFHAGRARYTELLESGVRISERRDAFLHAKTVVIDGVWSTVGSSNIDWRSFSHNQELNAVVLGSAFGSQMEALFEKDRKDSVEITLDAWRDRSWDLVLKERTALLFAYWL